MVIIQNSLKDLFIDEKLLTETLQKVLQDLGKSEYELLVRFVDRAEIQSLNKTYRQQNKATNVLAFAPDLPAEIAENILGDVLICPQIISEEAAEQGKNFTNHLIHIALHGVLHLLGFDHKKSADAAKMEALEVQILQKIGIENPY
ncbi:MAG: rRNA maturation RNase YbeY [Candidatus Thioglobus sp.]|nr:rRNA maturation RNase YbeY [Candidatus Thioglobus sp.]